MARTTGVASGIVAVTAEAATPVMSRSARLIDMGNEPPLVEDEKLPS